jgi:hemoglobin/transferrin/lactoferrin receptor protein
VYGPGTTDNLAEALPDGNPGWWTLGADAEGRLTDRFTVAVGVHNILDRHYKVFASGISAPGRDLRFSVRWSPSS